MAALLMWVIPYSPGIDSFDLESFVVRYMPRVRDAVIRGGVSRGGLGFEDAVVNALRVEVSNYLRSAGIDASGDDLDKWASLLFRGGCIATVPWSP